MRFTRSLVLPFGLLLIPSLLLAENLPKPDRVPATPTPAQATRIREGIRLHDAGQFDGAIAIYQGVLAEAPSVASAIYELAYSQEAKGDCSSAIKTAQLGAQYRSDLLSQFHLVIANCLDELGKPNDAIDIFKQAIKLSPGDGFLHYNLGVTYVRTMKTAEARKELQQSLYLNPRHPSSHYLMAVLYQELGYKIPAIFSYSRFLLTESGTERSRNAMAALDRLLGSGVKRDPVTNNTQITVSFPSDSTKDEGDFGAVDVALSLAIAGSKLLDKPEPEKPFESLSRAYSLIGELLDEPKGKGFAVEYYAPFFAEIGSKNFSGALVYRMFEALQLDGSMPWATENEQELKAFDEWVQTYRWPAKK